MIPALRRPGRPESPDSDGRTEDQVQDAIARIRRWGEAHDWRGYDPYDGLATPVARFLSIGSPLGRRLLTQLVKLSPLNLRPALAIRPSWNAMAIGAVASAYAHLWRAQRDETAREEAGRWLEWLIEHDVGGETGSAWGYPFDVQTRISGYVRDTPNTIATSFAAHALLDGCDVLGDERWSPPALAGARYLATGMLAQGRSGSYFRYLPDEDELVHNANLLACAVLARTARVLGVTELLHLAADALRATLAAQRSDGSWPYADSPGYRWIDNFHTGYVLQSLAECVGITEGVEESLHRGLGYWERELFLEDGTPKYFPDQAYPLDAQSYAQAVETWLAVSEWRKEALAHAEQAARRLIDDMVEPSGRVVFQRRRLWTNRVPFVRWTSAPAFRALARLLDAQAVRREGREDERARLD